jgi:hypothetical protein
MRHLCIISVKEIRIYKINHELNKGRIKGYYELASIQRIRDIFVE